MAVVFDLGGTHLRCGIGSPDGIVSFPKKLRIRNFLNGLTPAEVSAGIVSEIEAYIAEAGSRVQSSEAIVVSFPGPIAKQRALDAPTLFGKAVGELPDFAGELRRRTGRSVRLLNDVSAACWCLSQQTTVDRFLVVTVSSGIGSKIFDRQHPIGVLDDPPYGGEFGHYVVDPDPDALMCDCGGRGHLGGIASGRGVERTAQRKLGNPGLTNEADIGPAILRGDAWAVDVLRQCTEPLARTMLAVLLAAGLEKIFIIGGFAQSLGVVYVNLLNELLVANSQYHVVADRIAKPAQVITKPRRSTVHLVRFGV